MLLKRKLEFIMVYYYINQGMQVLYKELIRNTAT